LKLRFPTLAALAVTASLAIAGCGDDDDEPQPLTSDVPAGATGATGEGDVSGPLSKSAFITAADAICAEGNATAVDQIDELFPDLTSPDDLSPAEYEQLATEVVVPSLQSQLDQIRQLTPPEGDEDAIAAITGGLEDGIGEIQDDPSLLAGDSGPSLEEASSLATEYGFEECGS
jgi:hypothetical protein